LHFPTGTNRQMIVTSTVSLAAMEGRWNSGRYAEISFIGQPDVQHMTLDNHCKHRHFECYRYGSFQATYADSTNSREQWQPNRATLLQLSHHGSLVQYSLPSCTARSPFPEKLYDLRRTLAPDAHIPFPFIAIRRLDDSGIGRQPWLIYGFHTDQGTSTFACRNRIHNPWICRTVLVLGLLTYF